MEGKHETSRAAAAMMQGANYDDVAKVGTADRGNFRPNEQAHKTYVRLGPPF